MYIVAALNRMKMLDANKFLLLLKQLTSHADGSIEVFQAITKILDYTVVSADRDKTHSLYFLRRNIVERSIQEVQQFDNVLKNLLDYRQDKILIHLLHFSDRSFLFFTGGDVECNLGYIMLSGSINEQ